jgi:predicted nuclease of predicted toxin-antitoxin system
MRASMISRSSRRTMIFGAYGAPPKVIWLRIGDASTAAIEAFIRAALVKIRTFEMSPEESPLVLS